MTLLQDVVGRAARGRGGGGGVRGIRQESGQGWACQMFLATS